MTRNNMGWASLALNPVSAEFVGACIQRAESGREATVLDVGAGFGVATLAALRGLRAGGRQRPRREPSCRDRETRAARTGAGRRSPHQLHLRQARFPRDLSFPGGSFAAVHASQRFPLPHRQPDRAGCSPSSTGWSPAAGSTCRQRRPIRSHSRPSFRSSRSARRAARRGPGG